MSSGMRSLTLLLSITLAMSMGMGMGSTVRETRAESAELPTSNPQGDHLAHLARLYVKTITLDGPTLVPPADLTSIIRPYENRLVTAEELQSLRIRLTRFLIDRGFINSGVIIPDQRIKDGQVHLTVVVGKVTRITISGNEWLKTAYIRKRVERLTDFKKKPLNMLTLQSALQQLKQDPRIENLHAEIEPGLALGTAVLNLRIIETRPYQLSAGINNYHSPSIGAIYGNLAFKHLDLTGWGDTVDLQYGITEGLDDIYAGYAIPITSQDTMLEFSWADSDTDVVASPFDVLNIRSETRTYSIGLTHPFYKTLHQTFSMGLKFEKRKGQTFLLDEPFAFSEGTESDPGKSRVSVLRFHQEWVSRTLREVLALRSALSVGLDVWDATHNAQGPDGIFVAWLGQLQWIKRLQVPAADVTAEHHTPPGNGWASHLLAFMDDSQLLLRLALRLSDSPLLPMEKFSIGGAATVRGYRENLVTTDDAVTAGVEWQIPLFHAPLPYVSVKAYEGQVYGVPFYDFGYGWNTAAENPPVGTLSAVGVGLRWIISDWINAEVYWGIPWRKVHSPYDYDIQDDGLHFQLRAQLF